MTNYNQLKGRGEAIDSPISLLFKGYKVAQDHEFVRYITQKEEDYFEEMEYMKDLDHEKLMSMATNKFNALKSRGKWGGSPRKSRR